MAWRTPHGVVVMCASVCKSAGYNVVIISCCSEVVIGGGGLVPEAGVAVVGQGYGRGRAFKVGEVVLLLGTIVVMV